MRKLIPILLPRESSWYYIIDLRPVLNHTIVEAAFPLLVNNGIWLVSCLLSFFLGFFDALLCVFAFLLKEIVSQLGLSHGLEHQLSASILHLWL